MPQKIKFVQNVIILLKWSYKLEKSRIMEAKNVRLFYGDTGS